MSNKVKNQIVKDKKIILMSVLAGLAVTIGFSFATYAYSEKVQSGIADSVLRFHVKANSDSFEDQLLKGQVKNAVLDSLSEGLPIMATKEETISYITENIDKIIEVAEETISRNGYSYPVKAGIVMDFFPTKSYGDVTLPAGEYEALRIDIGEAAGANWWCVVFPPLCYVDLSLAELPQADKDSLKYVLTSEEYKVVTSVKADKKADVSVKFKIVEWWQNRKAQKQKKATVVLRE